MSCFKFILRLLLFLLPFFIGIVFYLWTDPFKVVKKYDCFYEEGKANAVTLNKDYVSINNWKRYYSEYKFDSYIFGNSRSMFFEISEWCKFIKRPELKCYHFDASGESLFGIERKMQFLNKQKVRISNILLVIDEAVLNQVKNSEGHVFIKSPELTDQNRLAFQFEFLKAFFDFKFFRAFVDFKINGEVKDYMKKDFLLDDLVFEYRCETNELKFSELERRISENPSKYYKENASRFYLRDTAQGAVSPIRIGSIQEHLLENVMSICSSNGTNIKVVISPLYDQIKINPYDLQKLKKIFGEKNVFDFSGVNSLTRRLENYYEASHYRPHVAREIMSIVYKN